MISILLPSRGRPENIERLLQSIRETADNVDDIQLVIRIDDDDPKNDEYSKFFWIGSQIPRPGVIGLEGPRTVLSKYWNECYRQAKGPYYMHCGDDIIFRTPGWDTMVKQAFPKDKIAFVHGDDGYWGQNFGTHGFLHKNWVDAVGYFVPPYFSSDYNDTWLNDVANLIGRRIFVPMLTEHMHFAFGKGPLDQTHQDRLDRGVRDGVDALYQSDQMVAERIADANKLRDVINGL